MGVVYPNVLRTDREMLVDLFFGAGGLRGVLAVVGSRGDWRAGGMVGRRLKMSSRWGWGVENWGGGRCWRGGDGERWNVGWDIGRERLKDGFYAGKRGGF